MHDPVEREILLYGVLSKAGATPISELPRLKHDQRVKVDGLIVDRQARHGAPVQTLPGIH